MRNKSAEWTGINVYSLNNSGLNWTIKYTGKNLQNLHERTFSVVWPHHIWELVFTYPGSASDIRQPSSHRYNCHLSMYIYTQCHQLANVVAHFHFSFENSHFHQEVYQTMKLCPFCNWTKYSTAARLNLVTIININIDTSASCFNAWLSSAECGILVRGPTIPRPQQRGGLPFTLSYSL